MVPFKRSFSRSFQLSPIFLKSIEKQPSYKLSNMSNIMKIFGRFFISLNFFSIVFISLVLLMTFIWIKLEMPDWSHLKDFFKIFLTVTNLCQSLEKPPLYKLSNISIVIGILEDSPTIIFLVTRLYDPLSLCLLVGRSVCLLVTLSFFSLF